MYINGVSKKTAVKIFFCHFTTKYVYDNMSSWSKWGRIGQMDRLTLAHYRCLSLEFIFTGLSTLWSPFALIKNVRSCC